MVNLRQLENSDKGRLAILLNNKKIWDNLRDYIPFPYSEDDAEKFIAFVKGNQLQKVFAIEYCGELCGVIGLILLEDVYKKSAEIGYWLGEPYWNKGIATKAVELITDYGFRELNIVRIHTGIFEYNVASMKVIEKNGYLKECVSRRAIFKNGKIWDEHRYYKLNDKIKNI